MRRTRIISLETESIIINVLPETATIENIRYDYVSAGHIHVTDSRDWYLDTFHHLQNRRKASSNPAYARDRRPSRSHSQRCHQGNFVEEVLSPTSSTHGLFWHEGDDPDAQVVA